MQLTPELIGAISLGAGGILTAYYGGRAKLKKAMSNGNGNGHHHQPEKPPEPVYVERDKCDEAQASFRLLVTSERTERERHNEKLWEKLDEIVEGQGKINTTIAGIKKG